MHINSIIFILVSAVFFSCQQEEMPLQQETLVTLQFRNGDEIEVVPTKAAVNLPAGRTVRIVVYQSEAGVGSADLTREYITSNTYEVQADGSLRPCAVDSKGQVTGGDAFDIQVPVYDGATKYLDFYVYSPAVALNADHKTVTVTNNMDFMATAIYGQGITQSETTHTISLPNMKHLCSAIKFEYIYNQDNVKLQVPVGNEYMTNRPFGLAISNLYQSASYTLGAKDVVIDQSSVGTYHSPDYTFTNPTSPSLDNSKLGGIIYLLPGAANNSAADNAFQFKIDILFSITSPSLSSQAQVVSYPACDGHMLEKGEMTKMNILVSYIGPGTTLMVIKASQITAWDDSADPIYFPL